MCVFGGGGIVRGTGSDGKGIYRGFGGISVMRGGDCWRLWGRGVLLGERGVTGREFTVDWGGFEEGLERRGAKRSVAERSVA